MENPAAWDQGAWGIALAVIGIAVSGAGLTYAVGAYKRAGNARDFAEKAVQAVAVQSVIAKIGHLRLIGERLARASEQNSAHMAEVSLMEWQAETSELLGLLRGGASGDAEVSDFLGSKLVATNEFVRAAIVRVRSNDGDEVRVQTQHAQAMITDALGAAIEAGAKLSTRVGREVVNDG